MTIIIDPASLHLLVVGLLAYLGHRRRVKAKNRTSGPKN